MASEIRTKIIATKQLLTITLASLANNAARQSTMVANANNYPAALIYAKLTTGPAPTANTTYEIYLLRGDDASASTYRTDGAGAADAAITIQNAKLLDTILLPATANTAFFVECTTEMLGPLGPEWGIAVKNAATGQAVNSNATLSFVEYAYYVPEAQ